MFATHHAGGMMPKPTCDASRRGHAASAKSSLLVELADGGHGGVMKSRSTAAGGIFIFLGLIFGAIYGINVGRPMLWLLRGLGAGMLLALLVWVVDRRRG